MKLDPLRDPRWPVLLARHPQASLFHSPGWLGALRRTYGYEPVAFTTSAPGQPLENGIVFCRVDSWLTGSRLVSLPFSDHCHPLVEKSEDAAALYEEIERELAREKYRYVELRPLAVNGAGPASCSAGLQPGVPGCTGLKAGTTSGAWALSDRGPFLAQSKEYRFHKVDLRPDLHTLYGNFHKSCIRRKIQRAERERLAYESGRSEAILEKFCHLLSLTRRRHGLPPQPMAWFRNLIECLGESLTIRIASKDRLPIAGILTLVYKDTLVYKYGGSDAGYHKLGGMPLLFWKAIQEGKQQEASEFDLGRSDLDNPGLSAFKEHLGAARCPLTYFRLASGRPAARRELASGGRLAQCGARIARAAVEHVPGSLAQMAGDVLYRHMG